MKKNTSLFLAIILLIIVALVVWYYRDNTSDDVTTNQTTSEAGYDVYFVNSNDDGTSSVVKYNTSADSWTTIMTFPSQQGLIATDGGYLTLAYPEDPGDTKYYSNDGTLIKTYADTYVTSYQHTADMTAYLASSSRDEAANLYIEQNGTTTDWSREMLGIPENKQFSWIYIADARTVLFSYNEPTGDAQREMHLSVLDTISGESITALEYPIDDDARFIGFDDGTIYLSRVLSDGGFVIFGYSLTDGSTQELYSSSDSYLVGTAPLQNGTIIFEEQVLNASSKSTKVVNVTTGTVGDRGSDFPLRWLDDGHILTISNDNQYHILDVSTGDYINFGSAFGNYTMITPMIPR